MSMNDSTSVKKWYWAKKGSEEKNGPVTPERLEELASGDILEEEDLIWKKGMDDWAKASSVDGLVRSSQPTTSDKEKIGNWTGSVDRSRRVSEVKSQKTSKNQTGGLDDASPNASEIESRNGKGETQEKLYDYASLSKRLVAYFVDVILIIVSYSIVYALVKGRLSELGWENSPTILLLLVGCVYFSYFHSYQDGSTIGKKVVGIKVINKEGNSLSILYSVSRYFLWNISHILLIGLVTAFLSDSNKSLHDFAVGSYVVDN